MSATSALQQQPTIRARDPSLLAPEYVRSITPYVPGKPISELARELGLREHDIMKLASNENPRGPSARVREAIAQAVDELCRYPDGNGFELKAALCARFDMTEDQIVLGNGSNDVLELAAQAFLQHGNHAVYSQHAFAVYPLATQARGAIGIEVPARDLGNDLDAMAKAITPTTRIVFVANPNNPTGTWLSPAAVESFIASVPEGTLVVLDEAYNEYLEPDQQAPSAAWVAKYPQLIVSRTFSKAHGLAALRIGYGIMHRNVADMMNRVRQPFNVNSIAQAAAVAALADTAYVEESRDLNREGMRVIEAGLRKLGIASIPSHANFLLIKIGDAASVYRRLLEQGVIVRPVANYGLPEHLRVTIGLPEENRRFLSALETALAG